MKATMQMYTTGPNRTRVIVFGGLLGGMAMAAIEGTPEWARAHELARQLKVVIEPIYGYEGPVTE